MKVFVAVVATVTDYRKGQEVEIPYVSVHHSKKDAQKAIMRAMIEENKEMVFDLPLDLVKLVGDASLVTKERIFRLRSYFSNSEVDEWDDDENFEDEEKSAAFQAKEMAFLRQFSETIDDALDSDEDLPWDDTAIGTDFEIPEFPNGEYVFLPLDFRIVEQEI